MHMHLQVSFSDGLWASITVGEPGIQGAGVLGMHGMGVSAPMAAAVAAATFGLASDWHIPNGMMFIMGMWSMMLAAGWLPHMTMFIGNTTRVPGAIPILHLSMAPFTTCFGIDISPKKFQKQQDMKMLLSAFSPT
jgi:hypothetical protein